MERITIQSVTSESKPKKDHTGFFDKVTVLTADGRKLDSYDTGLCSLGAGSVIDGEVIQKGKWFSLGKQWVVITKAAVASAPIAPNVPPPGTSGPANPPAPPQPNYGIDLELLKRRSIEGQTAITEIGFWLRDGELTNWAKSSGIPIERFMDKYFKSLERSLDNFLGETKTNHLAEAAVKIGAEKLPAEPEHKTQTVDGINIALLREMFPKMKWKEGTCMSWIEFQFKVTSGATLEETVAKLSAEQKQFLINHVSQEAAKSSPVAG